MSSPNSLGIARGSIEIGFAQLQRVEAATRQVGQNVARNLGTIDAAAKKTESAFSSLARVGTAYFTLQTARAIGQFAAEVTELSTAYDRQSLAALSLAGSQSKLNELMAAYDKVTGGAIDKANLLSQVTQLQAIGFADTRKEIEQFATAVRGISLATGRPQEYVQQQLQLAIANQSVMRLDQIGLGVDEVKNKVNDLKAANDNLTDAQAYQNAILEIANQKYGALSKSAVGQATGLEKAKRATNDARLALGQLFAGEVNTAAENYARTLDYIVSRLQAIKAVQPESFGVLEARRFGASNTPMPHITASNFGGGSMPRPQTPAIDFEQLAAQRQAKLDYEQTITSIERDAQEARLDATRGYERQRTETIAEYERTIARDAADFTRQRARAEAQFARQIADVQADAAKREAEAQEDYSERIADAQRATAERIADIEENYRRNRERAERTHRDNLLDAAARLDATAVYNEQRRFARESEEAKTAHDDQISQEQENLAERIQQAQEAHQEQLQDAREADAERIADMTEAFEEQKRLEDEDRAIRLQRMAEDHATQLESMAAANAEQMAEIDRHEADELKSAQEAHLKALDEAGLYNKAWKQIQDQREREALASWDKWWIEFGKRFSIQGPMTPGDAAQQNPWRGADLFNPQPLTVPTARGGDTRSFTVAPGAITVVAAPGQSAASVAAAVRDEMTRVFRELSN